MMVMATIMVTVRIGAGAAREVGRAVALERLGRRKRACVCKSVIREQIAAVVNVHALRNNGMKA